jgi:heat shock protein HslJ
MKSILRNIGSAAAVPLLLAPGLVVAADALTWEELANLTYRGIESEPIALDGGRWEGAPYAEGGASRPAVGLVEDFVLQGDLDADGHDEYIVLLWQSSGGSGTFNYLAVVKPSDGRMTPGRAAPLGDRVQVRAGRITGGRVGLDVVQQGEGDAACCPSQLASRSWLLKDGGLVEETPVIEGRLSLAVLEGVTWRLTQLGIRDEFPGEANISLEFTEGRVAGNSGCNRFSASVQEGETPGAFIAGPVMGTRMACADELMSLEGRFLEQFGQAGVFTFVAGRLVLSGGADTRLVFQPESATLSGN